MGTNDIQLLFDCIVNKGKYFEVRILRTKKGTISGYFNDSNKLIKAIKQYEGKYNIFFTLNSIIPDIASRSVNHLTEWAKNTTTDQEISKRLDSN